MILECLIQMLACTNKNFVKGTCVVLAKDVLLFVALLLS